jgi:hypothetical protein
VKRPGAPQGEAIGAWLLWALVVAAVAVTYARLPVEELYRVDEGGLTGGLGRALVLTNFPVAIVAVVLALVAMDALPSRAWWLAGISIALCALTAMPGVVDEDDLDARPVNAVPALGVLIAVGLTVAAARRAGTDVAPRTRADAVRVAATVLILLAALPWIAADLGTTFPEGVYLTERLGRESDGSTIQAVHVGHHHGWDGALLALTAIWLSRARLTGRRLRGVFIAYVSLLLAYGLVNATQDFWLEQVVKRGWSDSRIPEAIRPGLGWVWAAIVSLAAALWLAVRRFNTAR